MAASSDVSDHYEELLVNRAVLMLTRCRGDIDCGGLRYVVIKYGRFWQVLLPRPNGHVSVALELTADPTAVAEILAGLLTRDGAAAKSATSLNAPAFGSLRVHERGISASTHHRRYGLSPDHTYPAAFIVTSRSGGRVFAVVYHWRLRPGMEAQFVEGWERVTAAIHAECGSYGSRLHRGEDGTWMAYARWPNAATRRACEHGDEEGGRLMREAVAERYEEIACEIVSDLLREPSQR